MKREQDFGTLPIGVAYALSVFGSWMYGTSPEEALLTADTLSELRSDAEGDYFEALLLKMTNDNLHKASVIMIPDKSLAQRSAIEEEERISELKSKMTDAELKKIEDEYASLTEWQNSDEEDAAACLPKLELSDITNNYEKTEIQIYHVDSAKMLHQKINTNGIVYISMHFCADDLEKDDILPMSILSSALTNLPTKKRDVLELQSDIKSNFGTFYSSGAVLQNKDTAHTYLKFFCSALEIKKDEILDIIVDTLTSTVLDDDGEIMNLILQAKSQLEDAIISSGESLAISRAESGNEASGIISEYMSGYEAYKILRDAASDEAAAKSLIERTKAIYGKVIKRSRLTLSFAGEYDEKFVESLVNAIPDDKCEIEGAKFDEIVEENEFFIVPSKVAYAAMSGKCENPADDLGFLRVARSILSYEYLWNTIRVKNGAYGAGFIPKRDGIITFYSYRDPSPSASVKIFEESADYLRTLAKTKCDLTKFIIGAIGEYDILTTPKTKALLSTRDYLCGVPEDFERNVREKMLNMTYSDLIHCADIIEEMAKNATVVTVGGAEHLAAFSDEKIKVIEI